MLLVQQTYNDLQQEVEGQREIVKKLQEKYKTHEHEINDLNKEFVNEKQDLILGLKNVTDELQFYKKMISMVLRPDEIKAIRRKTTYNEETESYCVPPFIFKQKEIVFPRVNGNAMVSNALDSRKVDILSPSEGNKSSD